MAQMVNTNSVSFGTVADGSVTITHFVMKFGTRLAVIDTLTQPVSLDANDPITFAAGKMVYTIPNNEATAAHTKDLLDVYIDTSNGRGLPTVTLHTGAPGAAGDQNEVTDSGYTAAASIAMTVTETS